MSVEASCECECTCENQLKFNYYRVRKSFVWGLKLNFFRNVLIECKGVEISRDENFINYSE
jgi:hypothetical protein